MIIIPINNSEEKEPEELSIGEKTLHFLVTALVWLVILIAFVGIPVGLFVFCKCVLGLTLPWWTVIFSPVWFVLAAILPGGIMTTTIVLWLCKAMLVPWWVWVVSVICSLVCNKMWTSFWIIDHMRILKVSLIG